MTTINLPRVIAHRGARGYAPENTLAAMRKARELGFDWVEFDVALAACGEAVVMHDAKLNRTTNGRGYVAEKTYAEIATLDAGSWFSDEFVGEKVPTFKEMLACLSECHLNANIEIKPTPEKEVATAIKVVEMLQQYWPSDLAPPLVSSFSLESMRAARAVDENLLLGLLLTKWRRDWLALAEELNCVTVHVNYRRLNEKRVKEIKDSGRYALTYTVNEFELAQKLFAWGVDCVFSDYPDRVVDDA